MRDKGEAVPSADVELVREKKGWKSGCQNAGIIRDPLLIPQDSIYLFEDPWSFGRSLMEMGNGLYMERGDY